MRYLYIIEKASDGSYSAYVPDLPGCTTCGDSPAEIRASIKDAAELYLAALREDGQSAPDPTTVAETVEAA